MAGNRRNVSRRRKDVRGERMGLFGIFIIVVALAVTVGMRGRSLKAKDYAYLQKEQTLATQILEEEARAKQLEQDKIYVQTKQYIEEMAKEKLGLINENEIIFKPSN